jgi:ribosome-binding protein aMBF1 (putative translation factor)
MKKITTKMYIKFIKDALQEKGWKVTDLANKMALDTGAITLDQYRMAAQIIVAAYKKENW